jgi:hypothetical protein
MHPRQATSPAAHACMFRRYHVCEVCVCDPLDLQTFSSNSRDFVWTDCGAFAGLDSVARLPTFEIPYWPDCPPRVLYRTAGVIHYNDAKIQLLDLPGIIEGAAEGKGADCRAAAQAGGGKHAVGSKAETRAGWAAHKLRWRRACSPLEKHPASRNCIAPLTPRCCRGRYLPPAGRGRQVIAVCKSADLLLMVLDAGKPHYHREILTRELESVSGWVEGCTAVGTALFRPCAEMCLLFISPFHWMACSARPPTHPPTCVATAPLPTRCLSRPAPLRRWASA